MQLIIENENQEKLYISEIENKFVLDYINGLNPPSADIYTNVMANQDGSRYKSSRINQRELELLIVPRGDIEANRNFLYNFFDVKETVKIYYKNKYKDVFIYGYVRNFDFDLFKNVQGCLISIDCPRPFLQDVNTTVVDISKLTKGFKFPFSIEKKGVVISGFDSTKKVNIKNDGEVTTGFIAELTTETVTVNNPVIRNEDTGEYIKVNVEIKQYERLVINTNIGEKEVYKIVEGEKVNVLQNLDITSTWLQLRKGISRIAYYTDDNMEAVTATITFNKKYKGV